MPYLIIKHQVENFEKWKGFFDTSDSIRRMYGEKDYKIFRNTEDVNEVVILFEWEDPHKAIEYSRTNTLKMAMKQAGVIGEPILYLLDQDLRA